MSHTDINRKDAEVIFHCRRSLLFHDKKLWFKEDTNGEFHVTMGNYNGVSYQKSLTKITLGCIEMMDYLCI